MMNQKWLARVSVVGLVGLVGAGGSQPAAANGQQGPSRPRSQERIDAVASLNENLVEFALAGDTAKTAQTAKAVATALPALRGDVPPVTFAGLESHLRDIEAAVKAGDDVRTALASVEMYRLSQEAMNPAARSVPVQVPLLDYSGFKVLALSRGRTVDWVRAETTAKEARVFWTHVESRIASPALRNLVGAIMTGLDNGIATRNAAHTAFAAQMLLESVDLLEGQFVVK